MNYQAIEHGTGKVLADGEHMEAVLEQAIRDGYRREQFTLTTKHGARL